MVLGVTKGVNTIPQRTPLASCKRTPSSPNKEVQPPKPSPSTAKAIGGVAQIGSFWSTQHAQGSNSSFGSQVIHDKAPPKDWNHGIIVSKIEKKHISQRTALENSFLNASVAVPNTSQQSTMDSSRIIGENRSVMEEQSSEVSKLKEQLKQANIEKTELASKYEKLVSICQSQKKEIHELKRSLAAATISPSSKDSSMNQISSPSLQSTSQVCLLFLLFHFYYKVLAIAIHCLPKPLLR